MKKNEDNLYMVVEIPKHSVNKIEYNKIKKRYELDRVLSVPMPYPEEYGIIEETLAPDGDELDVICLTLQPTFFGLHVPIRIIGVLKMIDGAEEDDKLIAVNAVEPRLNNIQNLTDITPEKLDEIAYFFLHYKDLEKKKVTLGGFQNQEKAKKILAQCQKLYEKHQGLIKQGIAKKELVKILKKKK
ncbi:8842_t:CDS:1 [Funneliformis geosporum]|nr:8842_t:CDS:1 [Funneliformis geosporum]